MGETRQRAQGRRKSRAKGKPQDTVRTIEERVAEYERERNRRGKKPYTDEQLLKRLRAIRDGALHWMEQCVEMGEPKGSATALEMFSTSFEMVRKMEVTIEGHSNEVTSEYQALDDEHKERFADAVKKILGGESCASS